jgi:single-strand DNA-binding protein
VNDTLVTVVGNVVDSPRKVRVKNGSVTNFRLASTGRRYDGATQQWVDSTTFYVDVECWSDLSSHVSGSVSKGDPVVVLGAISTQEWETDAGRRSKPQIRAVAVGHNLARGMAVFTRIRSSRALPAPAGGPAADPADDGFGEPGDPGTGGFLGDDLGDPADDGGTFRRGRDYVTDPATLHETTTDDLGAEPVHS